MNNEDKERGSVPIAILAIALLIIFLAITSASLVLNLLTAQNKALKARMEVTLKDAMTEAVNSPLPQAGDMDAATMQTMIAQIFAQKMKISNGNVTTEAFIPYTDADAGTPAPVGIGGTIPGRSLYMSLLVTWTTPSIMGQTYTGTYHVRKLVAMPTYFAPGKQWN